jgi:hypothetical protein
MTPQNPMKPMYRLDNAALDKKNPQESRTTRRIPGNVPYVVDNLWEWVRPAHFPSRRHCVCASPKETLAQEFGGSSAGTVFQVQRIVGGKIAQIKQQDAKLHDDARTLHKTLLKLLNSDWLGNAALAEKEAIAPLWMPCLSRDEVESLFITIPRLAEIKEDLIKEIKFWNEAKIASLNEPWPFDDGEIFFEAVSWELHRKL